MAEDWKAMGLGLLVLAGAFAAEAGQDKVGQTVTNSGFELDANNDGAPDGWTKRHVADTACLDTKVKCEGQCSLRMDSQGPSGQGVSQPVRVEPGAVCRLTFWVRTRGLPARGGHFGTVAVSHPNGPAIARSLAHLGTKDWVQETLDFIGPESGRVELSCVVIGQGKAGSVWFDDVRLSRLAPSGGIAALTGPPRGCHALAEWALSRKPIDAAALVAALDRHYSRGVGLPPARIGHYLSALVTAAKTDAKARSEFVQLWDKRSWEMGASGLDGQAVRPVLEGAAGQAEQPARETQADGAARRCLARAIALEGDETAKAAAEAIRRLVPPDGPHHGRLVSLFVRDAKVLHARHAEKRAARLYAIVLELIEPEDRRRPAVERGRLKALADMRRAGAGEPTHRWSDIASDCQRLVARFPSDPTACFEAQKLVVECLMEERRHDDALAAAKVLYGAAPNSEKEITEAVNLVMRALKAKHQSLAPANEFVAFQSHGPTGEDGKKGTEDDLKNPLAEVKWAPPPEVEALFKKTLAGLPTEFRGRRWRGYLYLYWGKPDLALREFVQRYNDAPLEQKAVDEAIDDLVVALKAYHGHTLAGEQFMAYQKFGPKGKDGKSGTADDLTNPLAGLRSK